MNRTGKPDARRYPCIFAGTEIRATDDRIQEAWKARFGKGAPFGSLRQTWRRGHCRAINPYGSDGCPYARESCIIAFEDAVMQSLGRNVLDPRVYFISVARTTGMQRAETKPQERITEGPGPGVAGVVGLDHSARRSPYLASVREDPDIPGLDEPASDSLRRRLSRPVRIGEMLRWPDSGAREGRPDDGSTGPE